MIAESFRLFLALPNLQQFAVVLCIFVAAFAVLFVLAMMAAADRFGQIDKEKEIYRAMRGDE